MLCVLYTLYISELNPFISVGFWVAVEMNGLFAYYGRIEEIELDEDLERHLTERGITDKHIVSFSEILEVLHGNPRFFENLPGRRAPIAMVGPTHEGRVLYVPIEPTGRLGVWRPVTAFTANTHHVERYEEENRREHHGPDDGGL